VIEPGAPDNKTLRRLEPWLRRALLTLPPEVAHGLAIRMIRRAPAIAPRRCPRLELELAGIKLAHPIGLAAGFDKSARALDGLANLGFAFAEAGTVTPRPQPGNRRPRLFRLAADQALINRFGFNNDGLERFCERLRGRRSNLPLGANVGINMSSEAPIEEFALGLAKTAPLVDYVTINLSSPNTPGLRDLQEPVTLARLLQRLADVHAADAGAKKPLFLKIAPDLDDGQVRELVDVAIIHKVDGLILCNTTIERPDSLQSPARKQTGGLSGRPLRARARALLRLVAAEADDRLTLISVGGLEDGSDLYGRLRDGAHAVQIYTSFIYQGPFVIHRMLDQLRACMAADGFERVAQVIGVDRALDRDRALD